MARTNSGKRTTQKNRGAYRATRSTKAAAQPASPSEPSVHAPKASASAGVAGASTIATLAMDRDREYSFIRADLKRMLMTAGLLLVLMLALLFVID